MKTNNNSLKSIIINIKSKFVAVVIVSLATFVFAGCESASAFTSENRMVGNNFYGLILRSNAHVILSQGKEASIRIEGESYNVSSIETSLDNGTLIINGKNETPVIIYLTMDDDISLIEVDGNGKIVASDIINSDLLLLKVIGTGSIHVDVRSLSLGMIVRGNGKIYVKGSTGDSFTRIIGNGKVVSMNLDSFKDTSENAGENNSSQKKNSKESIHGTLRLHN